MMRRFVRRLSITVFLTALIVPVCLPTEAFRYYGSFKVTALDGSILTRRSIWLDTITEGQQKPDESYNEGRSWDDDDGNVLLLDEYGSNETPSCCGLGYPAFAPQHDAHRLNLVKWRVSGFEPDQILLLLDTWAPRYFFIMMVAAFMAFGTTFFKGLADRGKTRTEKNGHIPESARDTNSLFLAFVYGSFFSVPKRWFLHYYVAGVLSFVYVSYVHYQTPNYHMSEISQIVLFLYGVHVSRRSYECLYVHQYEQSAKMHVIFYLLAVLYYVLCPAMLIDVPPTESSPGTRVSSVLIVNRVRMPLTVGNMITFVVAVVLGIWAQYEQYRHHVILADLRRNDKSRTPIKPSARYKIPMGGWFDSITCPHYTAEILIYVSHALLLHLDGRLLPDWSLMCSALETQSSALACFLLLLSELRFPIILVFVTANLSLSALESHRWYLQKFETYASLRRKALVPFLY